MSKKLKFTDEISEVLDSSVGEVLITLRDKGQPQLVLGAVIAIAAMIELPEKVEDELLQLVNRGLVETISRATAGVSEGLADAGYTTEKIAEVAKRIRG